MPVHGPGEVLIRVAAAGVRQPPTSIPATAWYSKRRDRRHHGGSGGSASYAEAKAEDSGWTGTVSKFPRIQGRRRLRPDRRRRRGRRCAARVGELDSESRPVLRALSGNKPYQAPYFGSECDGGFAEFTKVPAVHAQRIERVVRRRAGARFPAPTPPPKTCSPEPVWSPARRC